MLKILSEEQVEDFINQFSIKCTNIMIEEKNNKYYLIINGTDKFKITNIDLIKKYL